MDKTMGNSGTQAQKGMQICYKQALLKQQGGEVGWLKRLLGEKIRDFKRLVERFPFMVSEKFPYSFSDTGV